MMKIVASDNAARIHHTSLLYDADCYANFLRFYDGICEWEEGSPTPVLHITWAKQLVFSLSKFDSSVREHIEVKGEGLEDEDSSSEEDTEPEEEVNGGDEGEERVAEDTENVVHRRRGRRPRAKRPEVKVNGKSNEDKIKSAIEDLVNKVGEEGGQTTNPNIAALAQACSESILNPEYLLGGGDPFTTATTTSTVTSTTTTDSRIDMHEFLSSKSNGSPFMGMTMDSMLKAESPSDMVMFRKRPNSTRTPTPVSETGPTPTQESSPLPNTCTVPSPALFLGPPTLVCLRSEKMKGLKKIFSSSKLNASAIKLQLTAQSQVHFKHSKRSTDSDLATHRKRSRRE